MPSHAMAHEGEQNNASSLFEANDAICPDELQRLDGQVQIRKRWAMSWFMLGLIISACLRQALYSAPEPKPPTFPSSKNQSHVFGPRDFQFLHESSLLAFGITSPPGLYCAVEEVKECQRQVNKAYYVMALTWHPDSCKYKDIMEPEQYSEMYQLLVEKRDDALYNCLNYKMAKEYERQREKDRKMEP